MAHDQFFDTHPPQADPACGERRGTAFPYSAASERTATGEIRMVTAKEWKERAESAEAERDEARAALRALVGATVVVVRRFGSPPNVEAWETARALVEGWGDEPS